MIRSRKLLAGTVITLIAALTALVGGMAFNQKSQPSNTTPSVIVSPSTCDKRPDFILIIADTNGFNDSISHGAPSNPWPVVRVLRGQVVNLLVCNQDSTQPHGFAIGTYLDAGIPMGPGEAYRIVFTATEPGTFRIYCNIFCTVHVFMFGQLIVSA